MDDLDSSPPSLPDTPEGSDEDDELLKKVVFPSPKKEKLDLFFSPSTSTSVQHGHDFSGSSPSPAYPILREEKKLLEQRKATQRIMRHAQSNIHHCTKLKELDTQVHLLKKAGGVVGLAKRLVAGEDSDSSDSESASAMHDQRESEVSELDLKTTPPGLPFFTLPAQFLEDLSPPYITDCANLNPLECSRLQENGSTLSEAIQGGWLTIFFKSKPCPLAVLEWLWEVACLSQVEKLRHAAFKCLSALLPKEHEFCRMTNILRILAKLGVNLSSSDCPSRCSDGSSAKNTQLLTDAVLKIANLVNLPCLQGQQCYSEADAIKLIEILLHLSLDPIVCLYVSTDISRCISHLVHSLGSRWRTLQLKAANAVLDLTDSYHNQSHIIVHVLSLPDLSDFQKLLAKNCLLRMLERKTSTAESFLNGKVVGSEGLVNGTTSELAEPLRSDMQDCKVALAVVNYFGEQPVEQVDYRELHSVMLILGVLVHHPQMSWPSEQEKEKFTRSLTYLSNVKIKNNVLLSDSGPVKDLLIRMTLEIQNEGGGGLKQQTLYGMLPPASLNLH